MNVSHATQTVITVLTTVTRFDVGQLTQQLCTLRIPTLKNAGVLVKYGYFNPRVGFGHILPNHGLKNPPFVESTWL